MSRLLLIDDDQELSELLVHWLTQDGFIVHACYSTQQARDYLLHELPDVVILDVMLPDGNGLDLLKQLRTEYKELPVLMLSARGEPLDRILGLELGADDYLAKPCEPRELTARLKAILRRSHTTASANALQIEIGDLSYSSLRGVVTINNVEIGLTVSESRLLEALLKQPGEPIDKQILTQIALGRELMLYDRSLDMHISNLRKKLGPHQGGQARILSLRGRGYYYAI